MATGASTADVAIILVDASQGVLTQTRRHSFIVSMVGVKRIILAEQVGFGQLLRGSIQTNQVDYTVCK